MSLNVVVVAAVVVVLVALADVVESAQVDAAGGVVQQLAQVAEVAVATAFAVVLAQQVEPRLPDLRILLVQRAADGREELPRAEGVSRVCPHVDLLREREIEVGHEVMQYGNCKIWRFIRALSV